VISFFGRAHRAEAWLTVSSSSVGDLLLGFLVPLFALHHDGLDDVVGVLADDGLQLPGREQVVLAFAQVQGDLGAARRALDHFDAEFARAFGFPAHALRRGSTPARRVSTVTLSATMKEE
jgi:hypothetical protein